MTEVRGCTITDDQQRFLKENHINFSEFVRKSIEDARCKHIVTLLPHISKWIRFHHINLSVLVNEEVGKEIRDNGKER